MLLHERPYAENSMFVDAPIADRAGAQPRRVLDRPVMVRAEFVSPAPILA
ncbi:MAG: hypothetical protein KF779_10985 [Hyphomonadaceae bacterium]|nr:hypothetical protein [Hyphomonadaceae bacterium]MCA8886298.1 hypothetical protein [Hyphomonadaceae bacterium]